jgi:hypothetical protein
MGYSTVGGCLIWVAVLLSLALILGIVVWLFQGTG